VSFPLRAIDAGVGVPVALITLALAVAWLSLV